jgi:hypothetical protein
MAAQHQEANSMTALRASMKHSGDQGATLHAKIKQQRQALALFLKSGGPGL